MNNGTTHTNGMNGSARVKAKVKSLEITNIDAKCVVDEDGREVLTLHIVDQAGKKQVMKVPFTQATPARIDEMARAFIGRKLLQERPELQFKLDKYTPTREQLFPYDCLLALLNGFDQRSCRMDRIEQYANEMLIGNWEATCQGWGFNVEGTMVNGQHSAWACIRSGVPIDVLIVRGLSLSAKSKIDRGYYRTNGCLLELSDHEGIDLSKLPPANLMNAILLKVFRLATKHHENIWNGNVENLAHMVRKYKKAFLWMKENKYHAMIGVSRQFTSAPILAAFTIAYMSHPKETAKVAAGVYGGSIKDRESRIVSPIYKYLEAGSKNKTAKVRMDTALHQTLRVLRGMRAVIEGEKWTKDPVMHGLPKTLETRKELLAFFSPGGKPVKLVAADINLDAFDRMREEESVRAQDALAKAMASAGGQS